MQVEVDQRGGGEFNRREALIELPRDQQAARQRLGHRLAGSMMGGEAAQDFRPLEPMLVELRGKLDEIARDIGARDQRISHVRQHPVQRVAEFVKQRARVVEAQQAVFLRRRLGEVQHVDDDRQDRAVKFALFAKSAHPGAAAL